MSIGSYVASIVPVCTLPVICALFWLSLRAKKMGIHSAADASAAAEGGKEKAPEKPAVPFWQRTKEILIELDAFGLILLGFGWSLFLLPFSLEGSAKGHWHNPSMIAMSESSVYSKLRTCIDNTIFPSGCRYPLSHCLRPL